jgi:hypothetical protein
VSQERDGGAGDAEDAEDAERKLEQFRISTGRIFLVSARCAENGR